MGIPYTIFPTCMVFEVFHNKKVKKKKKMAGGIGTDQYLSPLLSQLKSENRSHLVKVSIQLVKEIV